MVQTFCRSATSCEGLHGLTVFPGFLFVKRNPSAKKSFPATLRARGRANSRFTFVKRSDISAPWMPLLRNGVLIPSAALLAQNSPPTFGARLGQSARVRRIPLAKRNRGVWPKLFRASPLGRRDARLCPPRTKALRAFLPSDVVVLRAMRAGGAAPPSRLRRLRVGAAKRNGPLAGPVRVMDAGA